jgi:hypothetical protein
MPLCSRLAEQNERRYPLAPSFEISYGSSKCTADVTYASRSLVLMMEVRAIIGKKT